VNEYPKAHIMVFDPGKAIGWAGLSEQGISLGMGECSLKELPKVLQATLPAIIVYENYRLRPWMAKKQSWSNMPAPKVIGALEMYAQMNNIEIVSQEPDRKEVGYAWANIPRAANHKDSHDRDALAHGVFFVVDRVIRTIGSFHKESTSGT
jgi:hypothetical protein